jgi:hypothetical protein
MARCEPLTVRVTGDTMRGWRTHTADTIESARDIAADYGDTADYAEALRDGKVVAAFRRSTEGRGFWWYRCEPFMGEE